MSAGYETNMGSGQMGDSVKLEGAGAACLGTASASTSETEEKRGGGSATGGAAAPPSSSAVPKFAEELVSHDAKRARVGESVAGAPGVGNQATAGAQGTPVSSVPVATLYNGDISHLVEVLQTAQVQPIQAHLAHQTNIPQSFQVQTPHFTQAHVQHLPENHAPAASSLQPQTVSVAQDSVTADIVLALCGMRNSVAANGSQYGWDAQQNFTGGPQPKRWSNGRAGKRNLSRETVNALKKWYDEHQDWPYPNEAEQEALSQKTGIPSKMVNTWFINTRKRRKQQQKAGVPPNGQRKMRKNGCYIVHNSTFAGMEGYDSALGSSHSQPGLMPTAAATLVAPAGQGQQQMTHGVVLWAGPETGGGSGVGAAGAPTLLPVAPQQEAAQVQLPSQTKP